MDGFEATRRIRAEAPPYRHTSTVVMTAYAMKKRSFLKLPRCDDHDRPKGL